jgi:hypothetical protein
MEYPAIHADWYSNAASEIWDNSSSKSKRPNDFACSLTTISTNRIG